MRRTALLITALLAGAAACEVDDEPRAISGTQVVYDVEEGARFFDAPFPISYRMRGDGSLVVADFPNPGGNAMAERLIDALESSPVGFSGTAAAWFRFTGALDPGTLPDPAGSVDPESAVFLVDVDPESPELDTRIPLEVYFKEETETYSPANLLVLLPRPGFVLRPATMYAAVVTDGVWDLAGEPLGSPLSLERLKTGQSPGGVNGDLLQSDFRLLLDHLERAGIPAERIRAATVYRTGDPHTELDLLRQWIHAQPAPVARDAAPLRDHHTYCVIRAEVEVPLFQNGERPYTVSGGEIRVDGNGEPETVQWETVRFAVSIPKRPMPAGGWPLLFYSAGQGGAYTQFVDRGTFVEQQSLPGMGPAYYLADVGLAALSIEAPLVGPRHPSGATDGLEFFNVTNPFAFRDNVRQAAMDFTTLIRLAESLTLDAGLCPEADGGGGDFHFDTENFLFYGHSTGATIGSTVLGLEPRLRGGLLSGVGGSWLYNLVLKFEPMAFADLVRLLLNFENSDDPDIADPILNLFQTLAEPSEPMAWARRWAREPGPGATARDILVIEGVVDGYFPPAAVNALALAGRLEPVAPTVEDTLEEALELVGGAVRMAPASDNLATPDGDRSSLLLQYLQPTGISGHYVPFELPEPKYQYRCFFEGLVETGAAVVVEASADATAPCP
ncbi:MAG: hypothetical protein ABI333_15955 [bacterium]